MPLSLDHICTTRLVQHDGEAFAENSGLTNSPANIKSNYTLLLKCFLSKAEFKRGTGDDESSTKDSQFF